MTNWFLPNRINPEFLETVENMSLEDIKIIHFTEKAHTNLFSILCHEFWKVAESVKETPQQSIKEDYYQELLLKELYTKKYKIHLLETKSKYCGSVLHYWEKIQEEQEICFYGTGQDGLIMLRHFQTKNLKSPVAFCDSDESKWGTKLEGIPVCSLDEIEKNYGNALILITTHKYEKEVFRTIAKAIGTKRILLPLWLMVEGDL